MPVGGGDALFVCDVGRPDLFPGRAGQLADALYDSLHNKLLGLPDFCEVYPAHGAGTLCGRSVGAKYGGTIGYERRFNAAGGMKGYGAAGYARECASSRISPSSR